MYGRSANVYSVCKSIRVFARRGWERGIRFTYSLRDRANKGAYRRIREEKLDSLTPGKSRRDITVKLGKENVYRAICVCVCV